MLVTHLVCCLQKHISQTCSRMFAIAGMPNDSSRGQKSSAAKGKTAAPALTGKEKAQAIIAAALAEVKQDLTRKANNNSGMCFLRCIHVVSICSIGSLPTYLTMC